MSHIVHGRSGRITYSVPDDWEAVVPDAEAIDSLAVQVGPEGEFAPNVVVTATAFNGHIGLFAQSAMEHLRTTLEDTVIVDVLPWSADQSIPGDPTEHGRVIVYTHRSPQTGARLRGAEWLVTRAGVAAQMTSTSTVSQWPVFASLFAEIGSTLRIEGPEEEAAQPKDLPQASTDPFLSDLAGVPVERLDGLAALQRYQHEGLTMHGESFALFTSLAEGERLGRLTDARSSSALAELTELGLVEATSLSESGQTLALIFQESGASLRITAAADQGSTSFHAWVAGEHALTVAGPDRTSLLSGPQQATPGPDQVTVAVMPVDELTTDLIRWAGVQPTWNLPVFPSTVPEEVVERRWAGDTSLPDSVSPTLEAVWNQPWFLWTFEASGPRSAVPAAAYLNAGRMGHYAWGRSDEGIVMVPLDALTILDRFEDALQACLYGREPRIG
ncbi:hypothetical protein [Micrococcus terreus]|uniref:hypothetical protein n=1 Tax=Micrococcus terreus TaxID=574650 RepID=UPI002550C8AB|nr:hypothetical protein [Micrococcus terreus]MDK7700854.1 hypothetical protein [Micrococcus terreus]WOO97182.1 hypothetical protein R3I42_11855 [Micrococcus terreus]